MAPSDGLNALPSWWILALIIPLAFSAAVIAALMLMRVPAMAQAGAGAVRRRLRHGSMTATDEPAGALKFDVEDFAVEEEQGREGLILCGGGDAAVGCEVGEVLSDFVGAHLCRVALAVKDDEALDALDVGGFGTDAIMLQAQGAPALVRAAQAFPA